MINGVAMKGKQIIIPFTLQTQICTATTWRQKRHGSLWESQSTGSHMNTNTEHSIKQCTTCLECQWMQPHKKALHYQITCRPWEIVGSDVFMINDSEESKELIIKWPSTDNWAEFCRIWILKENCFRCWYKLLGWDIQSLLQEDELPENHKHHHTTIKAMGRWKHV